MSFDVVAISAISNSFEILNMLTTIHSSSSKPWMTQRPSVYELSSWHITQLIYVKHIKNFWMTISSDTSLSYYNSCQEQLSPFLVETSESLLMSIVAFVYKLLWFQITSSLYSNVTTSARINSTKCTYIHLCFIRNVSNIQHIKHCCGVFEQNSIVNNYPCRWGINGPRKGHVSTKKF